MDLAETDLLLDMSLDDIVRLRRMRKTETEGTTTAHGKPVSAKKRPSAGVPEPYTTESAKGTCTKCRKPGHSSKMCTADLACTVCGSKEHLRAACPAGKRPICATCGKVGHIAENCASNKLRAKAESSPSQHCFVCGSMAHTKAECPHANKVCDFCKKVGHLRAICRYANMPAKARAAVVAVVGKPILPAPPDSTTPPVVAVPRPCGACGSVAHRKKDCPHKLQICEVCGKKGHFGALCRLRSQT